VAGWNRFKAFPPKSFVLSAPKNHWLKIPAFPENDTRQPPVGFDSLPAAVIFGFAKFVTDR
jgi:hypothetical protein